MKAFMEAAERHRLERSRGKDTAAPALSLPLFLSSQLILDLHRLHSIVGYPSINL